MAGLIEKLRRLVKSDPVDALSITYGKVAVEHAQKGDWDSAIAWQLKARQVQKDARGPRHHEVGSCSNAVAFVCMQGGRFEQAVGYLLEGLRIFQANGTESSAEGILCHNFLAMCHTQLGRLDQAVEVLRRLVELHEKKQGGDHPDTAAAHGNLGAAYLGCRAPDRLDKARDHLTRALEIHAACARPDHTGKAGCLRNLALVHSLTKQVDQAVDCCREAIEVLGRFRHERATELLVDAYIDLARVSAYAGRRHQAVAALEQALKLPPVANPQPRGEISGPRGAKQLLARIRRGKSVDPPMPSFQFLCREMGG